MSLNPFAFLRGAAAVMATDLARLPKAGIPVQAGGDSHLMNFGAFVTPEDNILFDVNDFDETLPDVDFTIDVKRLAASVAVAALGSGAPKKQARAHAAHEDCVEYGRSVGNWPAFEDSPGALQYLKKHFKLVILSNVDNETFQASNRRLQVEFDAIYTAEDIGTYKPSARNFDYMSVSCSFARSRAEGTRSFGGCLGY